jgi:hypothetical protein
MKLLILDCIKRLVEELSDETGGWVGGVARNLGSSPVLMAELWGILTTLQLA